MTVIGMWGEDILFHVNGEIYHTFRDFTVDTGERWASHDIYLTMPMAEYLGPGASTFKMTIDVLPECGAVDKAWTPRNLAELLRYFLKIGKTNPLIIGSQLMTPYAVRISSVSEKWDRIDREGGLLKLTADVSFTETFG